MEHADNDVAPHEGPSDLGNFSFEGIIRWAYQSHPHIATVEEAAEASNEVEVEVEEGVIVSVE